jgi:aminomethyltransferase
LTTERREARNRSWRPSGESRQAAPPMTMTTTDLARTPLYDWHARHGGRMVDFAGWSMPVQYASIAQEHAATRNAVGVFDISHMGRIRVLGPNDAAAQFLDQLVTRRVTDMKNGQVRYALVCNAAGGILDDVLVYRGTPQSAAGFQVVVNASNRDKILRWLEQHRTAAVDSVDLFDDTLATAMIAVQGPKAIEIISPMLELLDPAPAADLRGMRYYFSAFANWGGAPITISRTGYTGEDGCEIVCRADDAQKIWARILDRARDVGGMAVGLGARDTLRLEAAMPLYGHELSESINPYQAGLSFAVNLADREFIGRDALQHFADDKNQPVRVGLQLEGKRVARQGCPVLQGDDIVGEVTSGTFSPTFDRPIAMAYVRPTAGAVAARLAADLRGTQHAAVVVPLPFYQRGKN